MPEKVVNHWEKHARQWELVGEPLRPTSLDIEYFARTVNDWYESNRRNSLTSLLLGVTPEIAQMDWPGNTRLIAADYSEQMIGSLWTNEEGVGRAALCADWRDLPLEDDSVDVVLGDGCFTLLPYPDGYSRLAREARRVLQKEGLLIIRFFISTGEENTPGQVHEHLLAGEIGNFHIFKFRLAIALQSSAREGVSVGDVWENWNQQGYVIDELAAHLGWQPETIRTIDAYRGMTARYTYPSLTEALSVFSPWFEQVAVYRHDYEFGENCPTVVMRPRIG